MDQNNKLAGADFLTSLVLMAGGAGVFVMARQMRVIRSVSTSPGLFPMILGIVFMFFGVVMCVIALRRGGWAQAKHILSAEWLSGVWRSPRFRKGMTVFGLVVLYVLLFGNGYLAMLNFHFTAGGEIIPVNTGFLVTTAGYLFLTFNYLKAMRPASSAFVAIVASLAVFYAFNKGFGIPIP